jgi:ankyrin repeat protein
LIVNFRTWIQEQDPEWLRDFDIDKDSANMALRLAIRYGDKGAIQILAPVQDNIDERDGEGDWTALMYAVHEGDFDTVKLLVSLGADVNSLGVFESEEDFALNLAAYTRNQAIFDLLFPLTSQELQEIAKATWPTVK